MHPIIENFMERPLSHKVGAGVGLVALLSLLFWYFLYSPLAQTFSELEAKRDELMTQVGVERRLAKDLPKFRREVKDLDIKLKFALQELPDKREIPDLLASISNLAREAGLEVSLFRPMPEVSREFYAEVPVTVSVEGTFHQVCTFFDEVGQLSRIVNINQIAVSDPTVTENGARIKAGCVATTFRYLDEGERIQLSEAQDTKKRKRR
ncbi:MAG: pilus assembly protein PilO [Proteobacteria bacterium]|nr:MAG: pilus assembly protein PilO [Pseudomonadota bacterium]